MANSPFFDSDEIIWDLSSKGYMFFPAGDFNNDGYDDLIGPSDQKGIPAIFYGREDLSLGLDYELLTVPEDENISIIDYPLTGDLDNDGYDDIIFNYKKYKENDRIDLLGTAVVYGSDEQKNEKELITDNYDQSSVRGFGFGIASANLGDINSDGYDDWGILSERGCEVAVYFGGIALDMEPDVIIRASQRSFNKSWSYMKSFSLAGGDLNGDNISDIVFSRFSSLNDDQVLIYFGKSNWPDPLYEDQVDLSISSPDTLITYFGYRLSIIDDYNSDGYQELLITNFLYENPDPQVTEKYKEAYLVNGGPDMDNQIDLVLTPADTNEERYFGYKIGNTGDINGDSYSDIALSDRNSHRILLYFGGPDADGLPDMEIPEPAGENIGIFGFRLSLNPGDFDMDGHNDIAIGGVYDYTIGSPKTYIYLGGPQLDNQHDFTLVYEGLNEFNYGNISWAYQLTQNEAYDLVLANSFTSYRDCHLYQCSGESKTNPDYILKSPNSAYDLGGNFGFGIGNFNNDYKLDLILSQVADFNLGPDMGMSYYFESPVEILTNKIEDELTRKVTISISPNPARDILQVRSSVENNGNLTAAIIDGRGKHITGPVIFPRSGALSINISNLTAGMYFVCLYEEGKLSGTAKFIKD